MREKNKQNRRPTIINLKQKQTKSSKSEQSEAQHNKVKLDFHDNCHRSSFNFKTD